MSKPVVTEYEVFSERIRKPLKIALVTDLHERRAIDILNLLRAQNPDLTVVAGDTLERYRERYQSTVKRRFNPIRWLIVNIIYYVNLFFMLLRPKRSKPDTKNAEEELMCEDREFFRNNGIHCLDNEEAEAVVNSNFMLIGGLSDEYDEEWLSSFAQKDELRLLLCHNPNYYETLKINDTDIDLIVSGHNHGGQIRIFSMGVAGAGGKLFPKYDKGIYDGRMVVSAGCSNTAAIPRINNPRELVIIHLKKR